MGNLIYYLLLGSAVQWAGSAATALIIGLLPVVVTVIGTRTAGAVQLRRLAAPCVLCVLCVLCVMGVALVALDTVQDDSGQQASERASERPPYPHCRPAVRGGCAGVVVGVFDRQCALVAAAPGSVRRRLVAAHQRGHRRTGVIAGAGRADRQRSACTARMGRFLGRVADAGHPASVIGNALWNRASRVLPLTLVGQMIVFETVFALLYGFAWEMRLPTPLELAAIACLLVGVLWCAALHAEAIMMSAADAHAPLPCRLHPAGTPPCASPAAIHRHAPRAAQRRTFAVHRPGRVLAAPKFPSQAATPAQALCAMVAEPPQDKPPTDLRADGMQQLSLASRCASALRRHRQVSGGLDRSSLMAKSG